MQSSPATDINHTSESKQNSFQSKKHLQHGNHSRPKSRSPPTSKRHAAIGKQSAVTTAPVNPLELAPTEIWLRIFTFLTPESLDTATEVCKAFKTIINDDAAWRGAFLSHFNGVIPPAALRLASTWRGEYYERSRMLHLWGGNGRRANAGKHVIFDSRLGPTLSDAHVDFERRSMMLGTLDHGGVIIKAEPFTGKISKERVFRGSDIVSGEVSTMNLSSHRILLGFVDGSIGVCSPGKRWISRTFRRLTNDIHEAPVTAIATVPSRTPSLVFASGANDGFVKIWDGSVENGGRRLQSLGCKLPNGLSMTISSIVFDPHSFLAVVCSVSGEVVIFHAIADSTATYSSFEEIPKARIKVGGSNSVPRAPDVPIIKKVAPFSHDSLLIACSDSSTFSRYSIADGSVMAIFGDPANDVGHLADITAMEEAETVEIASSDSRKWIISGDQIGSIHLWEVKSTDAGTIAPVRSFEGHRAPITSLRLDKLVLISGSSDGVLKCWDPLTTEIMKTMSNKGTQTRSTRFQHHVPQNVRIVGGTLLCGVAIVGSSVRSWNFEPKNDVKGEKKKSKGKRSFTPGSTPKDALLRDMRTDLQLSKADMQAEKRAREQEQRRVEARYVPAELGRLGDDEMLDYAIMLSRENSGTPKSPEDDEVAKAIRMSLADGHKEDVSSDEEEEGSYEEEDSDMDYPSPGTSRRYSYYSQSPSFATSNQGSPYVRTASSSNIGSPVWNPIDREREEGVFGMDDEMGREEREQLERVLKLSLDEK